MGTISEKYYYWVEVISRIYDVEGIQCGTTSRHAAARNMLFRILLRDKEIPNRYVQQRHKEFVPEYLAFSNKYGMNWNLLNWIFNLYNK